MQKNLTHALSHIHCAACTSLTPRFKKIGETFTLFWNVTIGLLKSIENKFNKLPISFIGDDVVVSKSISLDCWQLGMLDSTEGNSLCKCSKTLCDILD